MLGHADGISHSLHYQFTISIAFCCQPQGYQTTIKQTSAASLSGDIPKDCRPTVSFKDGKQCFYCHGTMFVKKLTLWTNWLLSGFKTQLPVILSRRQHPLLHFSFLCNSATSRHVVSHSVTSRKPMQTVVLIYPKFNSFFNTNAFYQLNSPVAYLEAAGNSSKSSINDVNPVINLLTER